MRRAAGVRRVVAVARRGAGGRAPAAAGVGAARRTATQVTGNRMPLHPSRCVLHVAPVPRAVLRREPRAPHDQHSLPHAVLPRAAYASPLHAYAQ